MRRRKFLGSIGAVGLASTAGCMGYFEEEEIFYDPEDFPYLPDDTIVIHWMYSRDDGEDGDYPNLEEQTPYMEELAKEYPKKVAIIEYKISQNERDKEIYDAFREKLGVESGSSPLTVVDGISFVGYNKSIETSIDERVNKYIDKPSEARRHDDIMSKFFELENPEPREEKNTGFLEGILDWLSGLL